MFLSGLSRMKSLVFFVISRSQKLSFVFLLISNKPHVNQLIMEENFGGGRFRWWHAAAAIAGFATLAVVGYLVGDGSNRGQPEPGPTKGRGGRKGKSASLRSSSSSVKSQSPPRSPAHLGQQPGLPADSKRREGAQY